jgi:phenylalanyl-tRNA synthetase alpha subunit
MQDQLEQIRIEALAEMQEVETLETLEKLRIKYFGRKGLFTDVMKGMGTDKVTFYLKLKLAFFSGEILFSFFSTNFSLYTTQNSEKLS